MEKIRPGAPELNWLQLRPRKKTQKFEMQKSKKVNTLKKTKK